MWAISSPEARKRSKTSRALLVDSVHMESGAARVEGFGFPGKAHFHVPA